MQLSWFASVLSQPNQVLPPAAKAVHRQRASPANRLSGRSGEQRERAEQQRQDGKEEGGGGGARPERGPGLDAGAYRGRWSPTVRAGVPAVEGLSQELPRVSFRCPRTAAPAGLSSRSKPPLLHPHVRAVWRAGPGARFGVPGRAAGPRRHDAGHEPANTFGTTGHTHPHFPLLRPITVIIGAQSGALNWLVPEAP